MVEILSHSDGFVVSEASLIAGGPEGRDAIRTALKELERYGYLHRVQGRDGGRFAETEFEITDMPEGLLIGASAPWSKPEEAASEGSGENRRSEPLPENPSTVDEEENRRSAPLPEKPSTAKPATANPQHKKNTPGGGSTPSGGEDSLSDHARPSGDGSEAGGERDSAPPDSHPSPADVVVAAYEEASGYRMTAGFRQQFRDQALEVLATGRPVEWVAARAAEMPAKGWVDLLVQCARSTAPIPGQAGPDRSRPERDASMCWKPGHGSGAYPADDCSHCVAESRPRREGPSKVDPAALVAQLRAGRAAAEARHR
ncbi:hypothetical protein ACH4OX_36710 [Streptomyces roseolus]|uniref:hypothetical protein n=1 Tax=Streptomyces roseolus TaxID=67358 RepID=UPI00379CAA90